MAAGYDLDTDSTSKQERLAPKLTEELETYKKTVKTYEKNFKNWKKRSNKIIKRYRDERGNSSTRGKRYNILWSNIQTLKPVIYARTPKVVVLRRWKNSDIVSRVACQIAERCTQYQIESNNFDKVMRQCRDDYLLPGRGSAWHRFRADFDDDGLLVPYSERVETDYVPWTEFGHDGGRFWEEIKDVWREIYLSRGELEEQFGDVATDVALDYAPEADEGHSDKKDDEKYNKARVIEYWCISTRTTYWFTRSSQEFLKVEEDILGLEKFLPCARPLYATTTNESLEPVPDFSLYQDQAVELDEITHRISKLTRALKVAGVRDASMQELSRLLEEGCENRLIPVKDWAAIVAQNGIAGGISFLPLKEISEVLGGLYTAADKKVQEVYAITGMADIIRGNTDPNETATAQQIKGKFATLRISERQQQMQEFCRDNIRIITEIAVEHFSDETLYQMAGMDFAEPKEQDVFAQSLELLRIDKLRSFIIDIETDSTIAVDESQEKQDASEAIGAISNFFSQMTPVVQIMPEFQNILEPILMAFIKPFRWSRTVEGAIESAFQSMKDAATEAAENPQEMQPSPEEIQIQHAQADTQAKMQMETFKAQQAAQQQQLDAQYKERELQLKEREVSLREQEISLNAQITVGAQKDKHALDIEKVRGDQAIQVAVLQAKVEEATKKAAADALKQSGITTPIGVGATTPKRKRVVISHDENGNRLIDLHEI